MKLSNKLSDCVARATGAVYARAWRQATFAVVVVVASLVGQFWGVGGVALGVVAAITSNFLLMAQLSLRLTGMRWSEFVVAHLPGLALAGAIAAGAWAQADWLRELQVSSLALLLGVVLVAVCEGLLLCWLLPALFLGRDGRSVLRLLADLGQTWLQRRRPG